MDQELAKLKDEINRVAMVKSGPRGLPPIRLKALRIKARTFLDTYRRALPRAEAANLRTWIERLDRNISDISARQRV